MAQNKRKSLGRGLSALIPAKVEDSGDTKNTADSPKQGLVTLAVEDILPGDDQPRQVFSEVALQELANSIKQFGVLQPIVVRKKKSDGYEIIAGERRWRASQKAGLHEIPCVVSDIAEADTLTVALIENVQREDLNAIEEAEAYQRLTKNLGYTQAQVADAVGKERATVANILRLLKLPKSVREHVINNELTMGHARAILGLKDSHRMERVAREAIAKNWTVRQTEKSISGKKEKSKTEKKAPSAAEKDLRHRLQRVLGAKVEIVQTKGKGKFMVHFENYDELDAIINRLGA